MRPETRPLRSSGTLTMPQRAPSSRASASRQRCQLGAACAAGATASASAASAPAANARRRGRARGAAPRGLFYRLADPAARAAAYPADWILYPRAA